MSEKAYQIFGESVCFVGGVALALLFIGAVLCIAAAAWEMARDEWLRIIKVEKLILKFKRHRAEFEAWLAERGADDVPVCRCKDCRYSYYSPAGLCCSYGVCVDGYAREDFYCADGKRKGECE